MLLVPYWSQCRQSGAWLDGMEQRREPRADERFVVTINGRDKTGDCFTEQVVASSISRTGALLSGISRHVRSGDIIWIEHQGQKSRFKVVWVRDSESLQLIQAAVHLVKTEPCPWANG
jgi:hypothetical protein